MKNIKSKGYPSESDLRNGCQIIVRSEDLRQRYYINLPPVSAATVRAQAELLGGSVPKACSRLLGFIGLSQLTALLQYCEGEEKSSFVKKLDELAAIVQSMPKTYDQDGKGHDAVAYLHYFTSGADWYITEKDMGCETDGPEHFQTQAFGLAGIYGDGGELGYISIPEILSCRAELDLEFEPKPLRETGSGQCRIIDADTFDEATISPPKNVSCITQKSVR